MSSNPWLTRIERLDPERDYAEIYRLHASCEFPWDSVQALGFALFRTYAIPSIGELLDRTGEFADSTQKRYDDTLLLMDQVIAAGFAGSGRDAIRRINQMHSRYDISNEDFVYVLATFVVVPVRWLDKFGWRRVSRNELRAIVLYYCEFGRLMGLKNIPDDYTGFAALLDAYERTHFEFSTGGRAVAEATLDLLVTIPPFGYLPASVVRRFALALMDAPLLDALGYRKPSRVERRAAEGILKLRSLVVRLLPSRRRPVLGADQPGVRSYPDGYSVQKLGTFPQGCPVDRSALSSTTELGVSRHQ